MDQNQVENKKNRKIVSAFVHVIIFIVVFFVCAFIIHTMDIDYTVYSDDISFVAGKLSSFFSVMIGVYVAVLVFLSTSRTPISGLLHQKRIIKSFSKVVKKATAYDLLFVLLEIFMPLDRNISVDVMCTIALIGLGYMIYFIVIVFMMFDFNIVKLEEESIIKNKQSENFITLVEQIERNTRN